MIHKVTINELTCPMHEKKAALKAALIFVNVLRIPANPIGHHCITGRYSRLQQRLHPPT